MLSDYYLWMQIISPHANHHRYRFNPYISNELQQHLDGQLLGDGNIDGYTSFLFRFKVKEDKEDYIHFLWGSRFKLLVTDLAPRLAPNGKLGHKYWYFYSRSFYLAQLYDYRWYRYPFGRRVKIVPPNLVLTPISLANWLEGDGSFDNTLIICTDCFSLFCVERLQWYLLRDLGLKSTIFNHPGEKKVYYRLRISGESLPLLHSLVRPYIHPCFYYRLGPKFIAP